MHRLKFGYVLKTASQSLQLKGFNYLPTAWIFKIFVAKQLLFRHYEKVSDLCKSITYAYQDGKT